MEETSGFKIIFMKAGERILHHSVDSEFIEEYNKIVDEEYKIIKKKNLYSLALTLLNTVAIMCNLKNIKTIEDYDKLKINENEKLNKLIGTFLFGEVYSHFLTN